MTIRLDAIAVPTMREAVRRPAGLPLTRRAMAAWSGWHHTSGIARRNWELACGLVEDEIHALERLAENLQRCGPARTWYMENRDWRQGMAGCQLRPDILYQLLGGLDLDERALPDFIRACSANGPEPCLGFASWLSGDVRKRFAAEWSRRELQPATAAGGATEEPLRIRVSRELDRLRVDLRKPIAYGVKKEIARVLGVTWPAVESCVREIRVDRDIQFSWGGAMGVRREGSMRPRTIGRPRNADKVAP